MTQAASTKLKRKTCTLVITHQCNLNCLYCYEKHKDNSSMSVDTAKEIISREFLSAGNSDAIDEIEFDFLGGEPFILNSSFGRFAKAA